MSESVKKCPKCGKKMIIKPSVVLACYPPITCGEWWCGCGYTEPWSEKGLTDIEAWKRLNKDA